MAVTNKYNSLNISFKINQAQIVANCKYFKISASRNNVMRVIQRAVGLNLKNLYFLVFVTLPHKEQ